MKCNHEHVKKVYYRNYRQKQKWVTISGVYFCEDCQKLLILKEKKNET